MVEQFDEIAITITGLINNWRSTLVKQTFLVYNINDDEAISVKIFYLGYVIYLFSYGLIISIFLIGLLILIISISFRLTIAALHFNENVDREQAVTKLGEDRWSVSASRFKSGKAVVKPTRVPMTYSKWLNLNWQSLYTGYILIPKKVRGYTFIHSFIWNWNYWFPA